MDDCKHFCHRFKYKRVFVIKGLHETHVTTSSFTLTNIFENF